MTPDVSLPDLVPDPSCLPDFDRWDALTRGQAHAVDAEPRPDLCNGRASPGAAKYVELRQGLLTDNERAFRAVRRIAPRQGEQYVRLGYCHEFFRYLESITGFWDDTSASTRPDKSTDQNPSANGGEEADPIAEVNSYSFYRTSTGTAMPAQYRTNLFTSFLKLVTYDFSCNIMSRQGPEPRLYIKSSVITSSAANPRHSYFSSGCNFLFRMPLDRDAAKRGIIDGPIAAVSPRHTTLFPPRGQERESVIDLSREIVAALITAQNRAREGRKEERIGKDAWWATKRRWGGGPGGPVGKEEEIMESKDLSTVVLGDKDEKPISSGVAVEGDGSPAAKDDSPQIGGSHLARVPAPSRYRGRNGSSGSSASGCSSTQPPNPKRPRKSLAIYDAYRMVRPPSMHWDPKTRYTAIGRQQGSDYDDVFVISSLFHHVSLLRVRVPDRLLEVLSGAILDPGVHARGRVEVWRTRWFDLFIAQDRVDAMKALWAVMAYSMRKMEPGEEIHGDEGINGDEAKKDSPSR